MPNRSTGNSSDDKIPNPFPRFFFRVSTLFPWGQSTSSPAQTLMPFVPIRNTRSCSVWMRRSSWPVSAVAAEMGMRIHAPLIGYSSISLIGGARLTIGEWVTSYKCGDCKYARPRHPVSHSFTCFLRSTDFRTDAVYLASFSGLLGALCTTGKFEGPRLCIHRFYRAVFFSLTAHIPNQNVFILSPPKMRKQFSPKRIPPKRRTSPSPHHWRNPHCPLRRTGRIIRLHA